MRWARLYQFNDVTDDVVPPPTYVNALHPLADAEEGPLTSDVIEQHDAVRPPEVRLGDGPETLLTCAVTCLVRSIVNSICRKEAMIVICAPEH